MSTNIETETFYNIDYTTHLLFRAVLMHRIYNQELLVSRAEAREIQSQVRAACLNANYMFSYEY